MTQTSCDLFLDGQVELLQPVDGYRAATDPVLLAASIPAKSGQKVLDVGCGVGAAAFCLVARVADVLVCGIEIQEELVKIAQKNIDLNNRVDQVRIVQGDLTQRPMDPEPNSFDHVMANPPFYAAGSGHRPPNEIKARAHMEEDSRLQDWVNYMLRMAKPKGTVTFINRVERLEETLVALQGRLGELLIYPIWSANPSGPDKKPAKRFILQGRKGLKSPLQFMPGLVMHHEDGGYMPQAVDVLKHGQRLDLKS